MNHERRSQIVELINKNGMIKNAELMDRFGISIETVRRDLEYLERQGYLERVYGGAVQKTFLGAEPEYTNREKEHYQEKNAIAAEAARLVQPNDAVFLDLGTTVLTLAQHLKTGKRMTVFTNALRTAITLIEVPECEVILPGGQLRPQELSVSGFPAELNMQQFNIDKAFIGVAGITERGITDFHIGEANLRRQVIKNARQVIVLADYSKIGVRAMNNVCPLQDVDILITDEKAPEELLRKFEKNGVRVIVAKS